MSKCRKFQTFNSPDQPSLFDTQAGVALEGRCADTMPMIRAALILALKECKHSRYEIAAKVSELLARDVSKSMLDAYCAMSESHENHRPPADVLVAVCTITGSREPIAVLARAIGCKLIGPEESDDYEITKLRLEKLRLERRLKDLERRRTGL